MRMRKTTIAELMRVRTTTMMTKEQNRNNAYEGDENDDYGMDYPKTNQKTHDSSLT